MFQGYTLGLHFITSIVLGTSAIGLGITYMEECRALGQVLHWDTAGILAVLVVYRVFRHPGNVG